MTNKQSKFCMKLASSPHPNVAGLSFRIALVRTAWDWWVSELAKQKCADRHRSGCFSIAGVLSHLLWKQGRYLLPSRELVRVLSVWHSEPDLLSVISKRLPVSNSNRTIKGRGGLVPPRRAIIASCTHDQYKKGTKRATWEFPRIKKIVSICMHHRCAIESQLLIVWKDRTINEDEDCSHWNDSKDNKRILNKEKKYPSIYHSTERVVSWNSIGHLFNNKAIHRRNRNKKT